MASASVLKGEGVEELPFFAGEDLMVCVNCALRETEYKIQNILLSHYWMVPCNNIR